MHDQRQNKIVQESMHHSVYYLLRQIRLVFQCVGKLHCIQGDMDHNCIQAKCTPGKQGVEVALQQNGEMSGLKALPLKLED